MKVQEVEKFAGENVQIIFKDSCGGGTCSGLLEFVKEGSTIFSASHIHKIIIL